MPTVIHELSLNKLYQDISGHVKRHKVAYSFGVGVAVAGITCIIMRGRFVSLHSGLNDVSLIMRSKLRPMWGRVEPMPNVGFANTASLFSSAKQSVHITTVVDRSGRGHPGWPVQNLESKQVFLSQKQAADAFGIGEGTLSSHLKGKFSDANGLHFKRVNLLPIS